MRHDHIISAKQLSRGDIETVLDHAADIAADPGAFADRHSDTLLGLLFFEPSTRTKMSFTTAMKRLGGDIVDMGSVESSSVKKGESLADTVRVVEGYTDALVLRHPMEGSAKMASEFVDVPLVNAGDGAGQHPTQTLLDLYTIRENAGFDDLTIGIMGDLKYGRTVHSLAHALTTVDASQHFISPESLQLPRSVRYDLHEAGAGIREHTELDDILPELDVLYVTRIQAERFPDESEYREVAGQYQIDGDTLAAAKDDLTVMHPLPRVDEIAHDVDETTHAQYFQQAHNGVPVRMALLDLMLGGDQ
ncbi:aspartate carbamoyltransferase [Haloarcula quadrata]|jgi:aspartate carbamoyltransferase catalytic subunit|uniref:Aspartate carbamoyltransferase catalytic subunit n=5 Tax=Haloarcula TaxID=2237 RepID=PYRB_HALMA|nr:MULTISPECIES: aspartate carbamoyltransferase [Haloarcula]Q5V2T3.1 RecName: Full=Aspartate carbamoyltransferase catalytic subunit; AltName: Full=Aspartate transcarbamylase; Short=ATCase [Haloarcula marismortui ATCC 43049]AAV46169.1 aspartate carbamoyltransferase [Haloarcula marismortui ATCC 43049]EMA12359.1 aspartate carbamoyltransferase catalytic subunit [Haloarcula californiae ATCC 33799]EMA14034.1 aspartate carbamoyltransferase catalytic subunit [Haloarcula sinaiiensis ATCC 33800]NHN65398